MDPAELYGFAAGMFMQSSPTEVDLRRGVSALYYGLFHQLSQAGAAIFAAGGGALEARAARAFNHREMWAVCRDIANGNPQTLERRFGRPLISPDARLIVIAETFMSLQAARETADYDLSVRVTHQVGIDLLEKTVQASRDFDALAGGPQRAAFLAALLLADRWTRRG